MKIDKQKILLLLAQRGLTKAALAELAGIARQNISAILERGTCNTVTAGKLAKGLGVPVAEIVKED
jgi:DNA-binding XRE family transcriptional regulator